MNKDSVKNQAQVIVKSFEKQTGHSMKTSTALEILSALYGKKNYNVLADYIKPETALAELSQYEQEHAIDSRENDYMDECVITTINGRKLKCPAAPSPCDYVRVTDRADNEIAYWVCDEWQEDPMVVMGAIIGALHGSEDYKLPQFAQEKASKTPALNVLKTNLSQAEILDMVQNKNSACSVVIAMDLGEFMEGIDSVNDYAQEEIIGEQKIELQENNETNEYSVTLTDISYTAVGAQDGQVLVQVDCILDLY